MPPAVRIENLSKLYRIGTRQQAHYRTLRESLMDAAAAPWRRWQAIRNHSRVLAHELNGYAGDCPNFVKSAEHNGTVPLNGAVNGHAAVNGNAVNGDAGDCSNFAKSVGPGDCPNFVQSAEQGTDQRLVGTVPFGSASASTAPPDTIWALKDVSFDVEHGEVVGIIGRNGAGKSTLLRILSRITEPTNGRVVLNGRVASLLEVGTGFHPELTGRENIYLNGAILGMHRYEIKRKFDAIVDFSGIDKFLDTPVKRYSSGMYVRLAFAVAAHLDPEILIVDEVLAVGDAEFQKKCLGKMHEVAASGRTVLFVSHNMAAVQRLCSHAVLLEHGKVLAVQDTQNVVRSYLARGTEWNSAADLSVVPKHRRRGNGLAHLSRIELTNQEGLNAYVFLQGEPIEIHILISSSVSISNALVGFSFASAEGVQIMGSCAHDSGISTTLPPGDSKFRCAVTPMILRPGKYFISLAIFRGNDIYDHIDEAISFEVLAIVNSPSTSPSSHAVGMVYVPYQWTNEFNDDSST